MDYRDVVKQLGIQLLDYELESIEKFRPYFKDITFYDVGAHLGLWSIMALLNGAKYVMAFEPNTVYLFGMNPTLETLGDEYKNKSIHLSGLIDNLMYLGKEYENRWTCVNAFVTSKKYVNEGGFKTTIDGCKKPSNPGIIKIDVEGMEISVLEGAEETIKKFKPLLMVETHDFILNENTNRVLDLLKKWGYEDPEISRRSPPNHGCHLLYLESHIV